MFVSSNLATSLDGKIGTRERGLFLLGTEEDRRMMHVLRAKSDVIVMGASTLRSFPKPLRVTRVPLQRKKRQPVNAIVSSTLEGISPDWAFFRDKSLRRILFVTAETPAARLRKFEDSSSIIFLKKPRPRFSTAQQILIALENLGLKRVLVEGGGTLMWDFASENLIDEYHVTLTPKIIGGKDAPTLVDGFGFKPADVLKLKFKRCRRVGDELYLTYEKTRRRG